MDESRFLQPTSEQLAAFVAGDPIAKDQAIKLLLPQLYRWAMAQYGNLPEEEVQSTIHQVLAEACVNHHRYDPTRASLSSYLIGVLKLRLNDLYQAEFRVRVVENYYADHEKHSILPYNDTEALSENTRIAREQFFNSVSATLAPHEQEFLRLMRAGEKDHNIYLEILRSYGMSRPNAVKNTKVRLKRKLESTARERGITFEDLI